MDILRALFSSKKFIAAVVGVIVGAGARYGLNLDPTDVAIILSPIISFIIGQGISDLGKDAAKINAAVEINPARAKEMIKADSQP